MCYVLCVCVVGAASSALISAAIKGVRNVVRLLLHARADVAYVGSDTDDAGTISGKQPGGAGAAAHAGTISGKQPGGAGGVAHASVIVSAKHTAVAQPGGAGATALWFAARAGHLQAVRELLEGSFLLHTACGDAIVTLAA